MLEIVLVLVILGIIAAVAAPRWTGWTGDLDRAVDALAADLRHAQSLAMNRSSGYCITFSADNYSISRSDGGGNGADSFADGKTTRQLDGVSVESGPSEIHFFYPSGGAAGDCEADEPVNGQFNVTLQGRGASATVTVQGQTGYVEAER